MKRLIIIIVICHLVLMIIYLSGCGLDNPGVPTWSIDVTVPFSRHTYYLSDLATDSTKFQEQNWGIIDRGDSSILRFVYQDSIDYQDLGGKITYEGSSKRTYTNPLGTMLIGAPRPDTATVIYSSVLPDSITDGYYGRIPQTEFQNVFLDVEFNKFKWIDANVCFFKIEILNSLPFNIQNLLVEISNLSDGSILCNFSLPNILRPGESTIDSILVRDEFIRNQLTLDISGSTPGTDYSVRIDTDSELMLITSIGDISTQHAYSQLREHEFSKPDSHQIKCDADHILHTT